MLLVDLETLPIAVEDRPPVLEDDDSEAREGGVWDDRLDVSLDRVEVGPHVCQLRAVRSMSLVVVNIDNYVKVSEFIKNLPSSHLLPLLNLN